MEPKINGTEEEVQRVIIDTDVGTDDYLALLLFLQADKIGKIKIEAIVCTMGNTSIDCVCRNVVRTLEVTGRTDIPVFKGASKQLVTPHYSITKSHDGKDGFGDLDHETDPDLSIIDMTIPAAVAMRNLVIKNPKEVSLICLGPLTNVALAIRLFDDFVPNVKELWVMGGACTGRGNVTATAEFNFYVDPEAVHAVLMEVDKPIYILTWETGLKASIPLDWRFEVFGKKESPEIQLLNRAEKVVHFTMRTRGTWISYDALLAAAFLDPEKIILEMNQHHASIELQGVHSRGQLVLDHGKKNSANVTIIEDIDTEHFKKMLMEL